jgi:xanthine dehydrogenase accessory factor
MFDQFLNKASELLATGQAFAIAEVVRHQKPISGKSGDKAIISADGTIWGWIGGGCAQPAVVKEALKALKDGRPRLVRISALSSQEEGVVAYNMTCHSGGSLEVYIEPVLPRPHILILGRSPVARTLARLAKTINYTVSVAATGADRETFPDADQIRADLHLSELKISAQVFVVVSTQGEDDEEALQAALGTGAVYVAFVASSAKAQKIKKSLRERGISAAKLDQVRAPAGLNIQARSQEEIAVSILAEIVQNNRTFPAKQIVPSILAVMQETAKDPICGMSVDIANARHKSEFEGRSFCFCCAGCKRTFDVEPHKYALANASK